MAESLTEELLNLLVAVAVWRACCRVHVHAPCDAFIFPHTTSRTTPRAEHMKGVVSGRRVTLWKGEERGKVIESRSKRLWSVFGSKHEWAQTVADTRRDYTIQYEYLINRL